MQLIFCTPKTLPTGHARQFPQSLPAPADIA